MIKKKEKSKRRNKCLGMKEISLHIGKEEVKLSFFPTDDMTILENLKSIQNFY